MFSYTLAALSAIQLGQLAHAASLFTARALSSTGAGTESDPYLTTLIDSAPDRLGLVLSSYNMDTLGTLEFHGDLILQPAAEDAEYSPYIDYSFCFWRKAVPSPET